MNETSTSPTGSPPLKSRSRRALVGRAFVAPALMTVCSGNAFAMASHLRCLANANTPGMNPIAPAGIEVGTGSPLDTFSRVQLYQVTVMQRQQGPQQSRGTAALPDAPGLSVEPTGTAPGQTGSPQAAQPALPQTGSTLPVEGFGAPPAGDAVAGNGIDPRTSPAQGGGPGEGLAQPQNFTPAAEPVTTYYVRGEDLPSVCRTQGSTAPTLNKWQVIDVANNYAPGPLVDPIQLGSQPGQASLSNRWVIIRYDANGCVAGVGDGTLGAAVGNSCWASAGPLIPRL